MWLKWTWLFCLLLLLPLALARADTLLVVGDSISAGYGLANKSRGWVALLEQRLAQRCDGLRVVNASVSGDTTADGLKRLPPLLERYQPALVVLELGGNDGLERLSLVAMKRNFRQMIRWSREAGARVVLLGVYMPPSYGWLYQSRFASAMVEVADDMDVPLLPHLLMGIYFRPELMQADGLHPSAAGHSRLLFNAMTVIRPVLKSVCSAFDAG